MTIKKNQRGLIELKIFCKAKQNIKKKKKVTHGWEKIFANDTTDKDPISKI